MLTKERLGKEFAKDWKRHYQVKLFKQKGFMRKECQHCDKHFWTLDPERKACGSPPCENYGFIGKPITKVKWDYVQAWKAFEKFFKKNGHASVPRYPVIDRWRPDLYFTIASIQDFQRIDNSSVVMEYPADPLVVPQVCLRFNDIANVGVTGRHHTSFIMPGQHSFGKYWKDRTIELNFKFINKVMGVPEKEIIYIEDIWSMPDFSQFGPSLETFSKGLELVNSVFSQFTATSPGLGSRGSGYKELPQKVVDVGWGHERLVWFTNGTTTGYDAAFEPVIKWMMKKTEFKKNDIFNKYSVLAGSLTADEVKDMARMRQKVAGQLGINVKELNGLVEPMQALYAIADHVKTLLFAVADGGIPSNVGGGYNLRVLLRRSLAFIDEHNFDFDLEDIAKMHAKQLKPMFPELKDGLGPLSKVLDVERKRYRTTAQKASGLVQKELDKGTLDENTMIRLYTSNGIAPEEVQRIAGEKNIKIEMPEDFYTKITEQHMTDEKEKATSLKVDVSGLPATKRLYYEKPYQTEFKAKVVGTVKDWVVLDKTCFYPQGGGQPADTGTFKTSNNPRGKIINKPSDMNNKLLKVEDVQRIGNVVLHKVKRSKLRPGQVVEGEIGWDSRYALMKMHTATHVLAGVARKVIGSHVWQAGAQKGLESTRIDLTHYERFSQEQLDRIEKEVNKVIGKGLIVTTKFYPRSEAESKYGFVLYQGGASPGKEVRVVSVKGLDVEACGGTHLMNTREIGTFKIVRAERIQDGVNRIEFTTSISAEQFMDKEKATYKHAIEAMSSISETAKDIQMPKDISKEMSGAATIFSVEPKALPQTIEKFGSEIIENQLHINRLSEELGLSSATENPMPSQPASLTEACRIIFSFWKSQKKEIERITTQRAKQGSSELLSKAKHNKIFEIVPAQRKELIEMANDLLDKDPKLTVILANQAGDVVGMSKTEDMGKKISELCRLAGGSGGGKPGFAQGRAALSKLLKIMEE